MPRLIRPQSRRPGPRRGGPEPGIGPHFGLARVLSKRGIASRSVAAEWVRGGRVSVDGCVVIDPEFPVHLDQPGLQLDGRPLPAAPAKYLMLNKPRGLVTTLRDEQGRDTVYRCLEGVGPGFIAPVGRLDKASEGLLLFTNDPAWAARITDPASGPDKTYHVQVDRIPDATCLRAMGEGVDCDGIALRASSATVLRAGEKNAWLQIVLDEGRNRQIRRLLAALGIGVLRLVRVAIGPLQLGELAKGQWRPLSDAEIAALGGE